MVEKDTLWVSQPRCVDNPPPARPIDTTIIVPLISALISSALTIYIGDQPRP